MKILELKDLTYSYPNAEYVNLEDKILSSVNYEFEEGKFYAIVGKSGTGKSTLLSLLAGLDEPKKGDIFFKEHSLEDIGYSDYRKNNISIVFQNYNLIDYLTPMENVRLVNKDAKEDILYELGLEDSQINRNINMLSGGQQQRVAIARALASDTPVILADEPTGNLDENTSAEIVDIFKKLAKEKNKCVIVVTHSNELANSADVILELKNKKLNEKQPGGKNA